MGRIFKIYSMAVIATGVPAWIYDEFTFMKHLNRADPLPLHVAHTVAASVFLTVYAVCLSPLFIYQYGTLVSYYDEREFEKLRNEIKRQKPWGN